MRLSWNILDLRRENEIYSELVWRYTFGWLGLAKQMLNRMALSIKNVGGVFCYGSKKGQA